MTDAWLRLSELQRTKFLAAILRDAMTRPASRSELTFWLASMETWERDTTAAVVRDLACKSADD